MSDKEDDKEEFCGACVAVPAAIVGATVAGASSKAGSHKTVKKIMLWVGIGVTVLSVAIAIYYLAKCKNCG